MQVQAGVHRQRRDTATHRRHAAGSSFVRQLAHVTPRTASRTKRRSRCVTMANGAGATPPATRPSRTARRATEQQFRAQR